MPEKKRKGVKEYKKEFMPPVELKTDPDYITEFKDQIIQGHRVTPREMDIFCTYHTCHKQDFVCQKFGITRQALWAMTTRPWWEELELSQLKSWLDQSRNKWLENADILVEKQLDWLQNPHDYPSGYGQALAKMMDTLLRASPEGLRPTLVSKFEHEYQADVRHTHEHKIEITAETIRKSGLTAAEIDDWNKTGVIPQKLSELSKDSGGAFDQAIDADFEDVEDEDGEDDTEDES